MRADNGGAFWNVAAGAAIGAAINVVSQIAVNIIDGESIGKGVLMAAATGAASGALSASGLGRKAQVIANAGIGFVSEVINQSKSKTLFTKEGLCSIAAATVSGGLSGYIGGKGMRHESGDYYKAAQNVKNTAQKVFTKKYSNMNTPSKLFSRAAKLVKQIGYRDSWSTAGKFAIGSGLGQVITRGWLW